MDASLTGLADMLFTAKHTPAMSRRCVQEGRMGAERAALVPGWLYFASPVRTALFSVALS